MPANRVPLTEGPLLKSLLSLALPIVGTNILHSAYQLVDTFWVGRLGGDAVAAVSVSFPLIFLMVSLGVGFTLAGSTMVAQYTGAQDADMVGRVTAQTGLLVALTGGALATAGYFSAGWLLETMGVADTILTSATEYLQVSFLGLGFMFGYYLYQSIMRGLGEVKLPLYIVAGSVLLNLVLDPLFIFGWKFIPASGVAGAAYATIGTQSLAMLTGFCLLFSGRYGIHFARGSFRPDFHLMGRIIRLGFPASVEQSTRALGMACMTFLVTGFGTLPMAIFGIGTRFLGFVIIPALGLSMATGTLVGQNMGAGYIGRAGAISRLSAWVAFGALSFVGLLGFIVAPHLVAFFVPGEEEVIAGATVFLRIMAPFFGLIGVQQAFIGTFRGSGNTLTSMLLAILTMWGFQFPAAFLLSQGTDLDELGIWWAYPVANVFSSGIALLWFWRGSWRGTRIVETEETAGVSEPTFSESRLR